MTEHLTRKHYVNDHFPGTAERAELINACCLPEIDLQILRMVHLEHRDVNFIADSIAMSPQNVKRRYRIALTTLWQLAKSRASKMNF